MKTVHRVLAFAIWLGVLAFFLTVALSESYAYTGKVIQELSSASEYPRGLTWDGTHLWVCDWWEAKAHKLDPKDGSAVASVDLPCPRPDDIAYADGTIFVCDATQPLLYRMDLSTGIVLTSYSGPGSSPSALAWDGTNLWLSDRGTKTIYKLNPEDGTALDYFPSPGGQVEGLAWDGRYLWASDRMKNELYMLDPTDGTVLMIVLSPGPYPTGLAFDGRFLWNVDFQTDTLYKLAYDDGEDVYQTDPKERELKVVYRIRNVGPGVVTKAEVFLAVPEDIGVSQNLLEPVAYEPEPDRFDEDESGQKVAIYEFSDLGPGAVKEVGYTARATIGVRRFCVFPHKVGSLADIPARIRKQYTADASRYRLEQPLIRDTARQIVGEEKNPYWIARKIYKWVQQHVEYELVGGWDIAETLIKRGTGSCSEYSFLYVALCRAAGLPARFEGSVVVRGDDASVDDVFHRWCEVYLPGYGWVAVDPSGGDTPLLADQGRAFGALGNRYFVTTHGGGDSSYLGWNYNFNSRYSFKGATEVKEEAFGIWEPVE
ncbi:MAG: transglutaminase [Candidatus Eisenbacteria bacterium]|nr:transglutaminase [Candidatus Eisenbacteria bacterium]